MTRLVPLATVLYGLAFVGLIAACGGPTKGSATGARSGGDDGSAREAPIQVVNTSLDCSDGSCFECGEGICLTGQYCDEKTHACSWLAECATEATCACVTQVLGAGCSCSDDGGVHVTCE